LRTAVGRAAWILSLLRVLPVNVGLILKLVHSNPKCAARLR